MEEGSIGVEVLIVGLGWPTPTEDMEFCRPALGEPSFAAARKTENDQKFRFEHSDNNYTQQLINNKQRLKTQLEDQKMKRKKSEVVLIVLSVITYLING